MTFHGRRDFWIKPQRTKKISRVTSCILDKILVLYLSVFMVLQIEPGPLHQATRQHLLTFYATGSHKANDSFRPGWKLWSSRLDQSRWKNLELLAKPATKSLNWFWRQDRTLGSRRAGFCWPNWVLNVFQICFCRQHLVVPVYTQTLGCTWPLWCDLEKQRGLN